MFGNLTWCFNFITVRVNKCSSEGDSNINQENEINANIHYVKNGCIHVVWFKCDLEWNCETIKYSRYHNNQVPLTLKIVIRPKNELILLLILN